MNPRINTPLYHLLCWLIICGLPGMMMAQKSQKVLPMPEAYENPINPYAEGGNAEAFTRNWDRKSNQRWLVFVDRDNVQSFDAPRSTTVARKLSFGAPYYVIKVDGDWLQLASGSLSKSTLKDAIVAGWVHKRNLLLWKSGLRNRRTRIHLKAVLLNKFDNMDAIDCDDKELVEVFLDPNSAQVSKNARIYQFYFVYKYENGRYLLGADHTMNEFVADNELFGWISEERIATWNTRVALEPNYAENAYNERKTNRNLQIVGFPDQVKAETYNNSGQMPDGRDISTRQDPIIRKKAELSTSNPRRMGAQYFRFPLLSTEAGGGAPTFLRSAVLEELLVKKGCDPVTGKIIYDRLPFENAHKVMAGIESYQKSASRFNVFFVVESSAKMLEYQATIAALPRRIKEDITRKTAKATVRFGALSYQDVATSTDPRELINSVALSANAGKVEQFLRSIPFNNPANINQNTPVLHYGLMKALETANFSPFETNIIVVIGTKGDYSYQRTLKRKYAGMPVDVDVVSIENAINAGSVNLMAFQCIGGEGVGDKSFTKRIRGAMLEAARQNYNNKFAGDNLEARLKPVLEKNGFEVKPPFMVDPLNSSVPLLELENGTLKGNVNRIEQAGKKLPPNVLADRMIDQTAEVVTANIDLASKIEDWKHNSVDIAGLTMRQLEILQEMYKMGGQDVSSWVEEKFNVYNETYFAPQPKGAAYAPFQFVLFYPETDLSIHLINVGNMLDLVGGVRGGARRKKLQEGFCQLFAQFTGDTERNCGEQSIEALAREMAGVQLEGVNFGLSSVRIKDLDNERIVDEATINKIIQEFARIRNNLKEMRDTQNYEFRFTQSNETYYWVNIEDMLPKF